MTKVSGGTLLDGLPDRGQSLLAPDDPRRKGRRQGAAEVRSGEVPPRRERGRGAEPLTRLERRRLRSRDRRRFFLAPLLVLCLTVAGYVIRDQRHRDDARRAAATADANAPAVAVAPPQTVLFAHQGPDGRADLVFVAGVGGVPRRGAVLLMPTGTQVEVPSLGLQTLADLPKLGDAGLLQTSVENLLGVRITKAITTSDIALLAAVDPAGPLVVNLRNPVHLDDGVQVVSFPAGEQRFVPADVARLLGRREQGDERDHLRTVQSVMESWLAALRDQGVGASTTERIPELAALVVAAGTETRMLTLAVAPAGLGGGSELYRVDRRDLRTTVSNAFPYALMAKGQRPRLQLLNGTGAVGLAQQVAGCVVPAGYEVVLTDNVAGFGVAQTMLVAQRSRDLVAVRRLAKVLGVGQARQAARASDLVDVTIVIGADFQGCTRASGG